MINENGQFDLLTEADALELARDMIIAAGLTVTPGSVEEELQAVIAQQILAYDTNQYQNFLIYTAPEGLYLDLQNPGIPRLQAGPASGYLELVNDTDDPINVLINSIFTSATGNAYSTFNNTVIVSAHSTSYISVTSVLNGKSQNLVRATSFTSDYDLTVTNPQPFTNGRDLETDTEYKTRLIERKTNLSSYHATNTAVAELNEFYEDSIIYTNPDSNGQTDPIPIPPTGYTTVVLTPSGVTASSEELNNAFQILANRLQFGNSIKNGSSLHPVLSGVIYSGNFPNSYYLIPAQSVQFTLECTLHISFDSKTSEQEKEDLAIAFAQFFAQNVNNYFGGAAGACNVTFNPLDPYSSPVVTIASVEAASGILQKIAPSFSLEQVRALISEASNFESVNRLKYELCDALAIELDPLIAYEPIITLDINDMTEPDSVDFARTALFSDDTSWFDRYIFIDPSLISIVLDEVSY